MKKITILAFALSLSSSAFAGVFGDPILFQKNSTWVSSLNSTLCTDGTDYRAYVVTCAQYRRSKGGGRSCELLGRTLITQPMNSEKEQCVKYSGRDQSTCALFETVPYYQSPTRTVIYSNEHDTDQRKVTITIPACAQN